MLLGRTGCWIWPGGMMPEYFMLLQAKRTERRRFSLLRNHMKERLTRLDLGPPMRRVSGLEKRYVKPTEISTAWRQEWQGYSTATGQGLDQTVFTEELSLDLSFKLLEASVSPFMATGNKPVLFVMLAILLKPFWSK